MSIETLGEAYAAGWGVRLSCAQPSRVGTTKVGRCMWSGNLDMMTLVATRGHGLPLERLADLFRCPGCGSRRVRVLCEVPSGSRRA